MPPAGELVVLESGSLRLHMWPRMGGKIVSVVVCTQEQEEELLHPPIQAYKAAAKTSSFSESDAGGWDECLPSVAACTFAGSQIPDHGDLWRLPWQAEIVDHGTTGSVDAFSTSLRFDRQLDLSEDTLTLVYRVENTGEQPASFLWSAHPLFRVEEGDTILLPSSVASVRVESSTLELVCDSSGYCPWPIAQLHAGGTIDLGRVGKKDGTTAHKLFAGPLVEGWCGLYRQKLGLGILFHIDLQRTPFAGLWISHGAWPAGSAERQYTVALEPTTANTDALDRAASMGLAQQLAPGESRGWLLRMHVLGARTPNSLEEFQALAQKIGEEDLSAAALTHGAAKSLSRPDSIL